MNYCIERPRRPTGIRSAEHPLEPAVPQRWTVAFAAAAGLIFSVGPIVQFSFGVFIKPVGDSLHTDRAGVSSALLIALCLSGLMTPILGRLVDRFGLRRVALPAVALFALAVTLIGVASVSLFWFVLCYALTGVFSAAQTPLVYGTVITSAFDSRRGLALGIAMAGVGVGTVMVPRLAQYLVTTFGWREAYVALGALTLVTVIPALLGLLRGRPIRTAATAPARVRGTLRSRVALRSLLFWKLAAAFMATAAASSGVTAHLVPMMTDRHVSSETASMAISSAGIALILGRLGAGFLLDCLFAPYVAMAFFLLPLAGIVVLLTNVSVSAAIGAASLVGMGLGAEVDLIAYLQSRYLGLGYFAETYGYFLAVFMVGSGVGPFVMGVAYSHTGNYVAALVLLAAGLIAASAVMLTLGPYKYRLRTDNLVSN
jgi:predicted MFS family arabinose efflux permease